MTRFNMFTDEELDAIDRAEAMTEIMMFAGNVKSDEEDIYIKVSDAVQLLRELPLVTPKCVTVTDFADKCRECGRQKKGKWIAHDESITLLTGDTATGGVICSECGYKTHNKVHVIVGCPYNYCPICGARMVGEEDVSQ